MCGMVDRATFDIRLSEEKKKYQQNADAGLLPRLNNAISEYVVVHLSIFKEISVFENRQTRKGCEVPRAGKSFCIFFFCHSNTRQKLHEMF